MLVGGKAEDGTEDGHSHDGRGRASLIGSIIETRGPRPPPPPPVPVEAMEQLVPLREEAPRDIGGGAHSGGRPHRTGERVIGRWSTAPPLSEPTAGLGVHGPEGDASTPLSAVGSGRLPPPGRHLR